MSETTATTAPQGGYGYASDEVKQSPFNFGLNSGLCYLTKFEWINNGGKDGAEAEALDIVFNINGTDKNYRMFPVTKAFDKDNNEVTDPNNQAMIDALIDFNARVTHILHAFLPTDTIKAGLSRPITSFKEYCQITAALLPKEFTKMPLDIFLQYQWQISEGKERTYLDIPKKMSYGKWLCPAQPGKWKEVKETAPSDTSRTALIYIAENGVTTHPFIRNGWFMNSNFAIQQKIGGAAANTEVGKEAMSVAKAGSTATW